MNALIPRRRKIDGSHMRREQVSMLYCRKFAFHIIAVCLAIILPLAAYADAAKDALGKEMPVVRDVQAKDTSVASQDRATKEAKKPAEREKAAPAVPEKKAEASQENQDQDIMEQALALIDASQEYWVKGDVENALEMLDQAYALILDTNGEPDIARQKDDLRLLISKKILAVYSSMQTVTPGKRSEIPLTINADVEKEIRSFQGYERDFFISSYQRSFIYRPMIVRELKKAGLPEELSWLPLVESGFKIAALSRARALGLWQFIPSTGYKYNLNRDDWVDERMDAEKSTRAAIAYLRELHGMFGDWLTVLAAYNCGEGRVMRLISRQHINYLDRFWDLYHQLPNETARYVPRFLATLHIIKDPKKYNMDLTNGGGQKPLPLTYTVVKTNKPMRLQDIAQHLNMSEDLLGSLNTELRFKVTPEKLYNLKVPPEMVEKYDAVSNDIPRWEKPLPVKLAKKKTITITHRVRKGESIQTIAKKYGTSAKTIRTYNQLSAKKGGLYVGQHLTIPMKVSQASLKKSAREDMKATGSGGVISYKVKKKDTLASIADRYNLSVAEIKQMNRLKSNTVKPGQVLRIAKSTDDDADTSKKSSATKKKTSKKKADGKESAAGKSKTYVVQKGDSLYRIAANKSVKVERLKELNHLSSKSTLREGQVLVLE